MKTRSVRIKASGERSSFLAWIFLLIALSCLGGCLYYIWSIFSVMSWAIYFGYDGTWIVYDIFMAVIFGVSSMIFFGLFAKYRTSARLIL